MAMTRMRLGIGILFVVGCGTSFVAGRAAQAPAPAPVLRSKSGSELRMLLDKQRLGSSEISIAEMTLSAGLSTSEHTHGALEIFYVLSGELEHVVNGKSYILKPGMLGFVKPPDKVQHKVGPGGPMKALAIWVPGDEGARVAERW
jgi:quercetin dioxygenase-like cupin family protein